MNSSMIRYVIGQVIRIEGVLMLLPAFVGAIYQESQGLTYLLCAAILIGGGWLLCLKKPEDNVFYLKEGCVMTALSWIVMSILGAIPFIITGEIPHFVDALFEVVSGFTTTGSSILSDVEALSHPSLFWRSFTHWVGGMGVLVFLLAIVPLSGGSSINLMRAESPGPEVDKNVPKMRQSAGILYVIYAIMTVIQIVLLIIAGMPVFDSLCMTFGSAGTGGFGILNDSAASYNVVCQWILTIFMILFGVNFNFYYYLLDRKAGKAFAMEEVKAYFLIILVAVAFITVNILPQTKGWFDALTKSAFQVGSIITTTGFSTTNFNLWPAASRMILVLLMFIGACAGSTGGGLKVSRVVILVKSVRKEMHSYAHPRNVEKVYLDKKPVSHGTVRSINVYLVTYLVIFVTSLFCVCAVENTDLVTAFTSVAATFNNIGPGLDKVGPAANFGWLHPFSKYVLIFDMLAGRLELFPMLVLLYPRIWSESIERNRAKRRLKFLRRNAERNQLQNQN